MRNLTEMWVSEDEDTMSVSRIIWLTVGILVTIISIIVISLLTKRAISKAMKQYNIEEETKALSEIELSITNGDTDSSPANSSDDIDEDCDSNLLSRRSLGL